jgi:hypothetical protein
MVRLFNYLLWQKHLGSALIQLGGLEPPTSCSTGSRFEEPCNGNRLVTEPARVGCDYYTLRSVIFAGMRSVTFQTYFRLQEDWCRKQDSNL